MYRHDGSNGARARSARIRSDHDYEATQLDSLARRSATPGGQSERVRWWRSPAVAFIRLVARHATRSAHDDVGVPETADAPTGAI
jgi:hypothetical protein